MSSEQLFGIAMLGYLVATFFYIAYVVSTNKKVGIAATSVAVAGCVANTIAFGARYLESHRAGFAYMPLSNMYESMVFFAWSVMLIYLVFEFVYGYKVLGVFASIFGFLGIAIVSFGAVNREIQPLVPALQSNWLTSHVVTCFFGYAAFAVSYAVALIYLIRQRHPLQMFLLVAHPLLVPIFISGLSLIYGMVGREPFAAVQTQLYTWLGALGVSAFFGAMIFVLRGAEGLLPPNKVLDELSYKAVAVGFPLLTLGILTGAAWANYAWGTYWSWDPKETWSLITWFIYAAFLHARLTAGWRGLRLAWMSVIGFGAVIFTYWGVNFVLSGLHSYG